MQDIIVYLLILIALINTIYQSIRIIAKKNTDNCGGCPNCGLKNELKHKKIIIH